LLAGTGSLSFADPASLPLQPVSPRFSVPAPGDLVERDLGQPVRDGAQQVHEAPKVQGLAQRDRSHRRDPRPPFFFDGRWCTKACQRFSKLASSVQPSLVRQATIAHA
jgi:hypothetical protein